MQPVAKNPSSPNCCLSTLQDGKDTEAVRLLKNILPDNIIRRLQDGDKFVADSHQHVVILFSGV